MIVHPHIGQRVQLWYAAYYCEHMPYHGRTGTVCIVSRGPGPRNHGVTIDGHVVCVPCGNLRPWPIKKEPADV